MIHFITYLKKLIRTCFIKRKYTTHTYTEVIVFTPEGYELE